MKLTFIDRKDIPKRQKNFDILKEFADSNASAARVDDHGYRDANNAAASINISAKRFGMTGIKAITRNKTLYLIKEI